MLSHAQLGSPIIKHAPGSILPTNLSPKIEQADLLGSIDARLTLSGQSLQKTSPVVTGTITPASLALNLGDQRMDIDSMQGDITLDQTGGSFDSLRLQADGWWVTLKGTWVGTGDGSVLLQGVLDGESQVGLRDDIRALLPDSLRSTLDGLKINASSPLKAEHIELHISSDDTNDTAFRSTGRIIFNDAQAAAGVNLKEASGYLDYATETMPGTTLPNLGIGIVFDRVRAAGVMLHNGAMRITSDPTSGLILLPVFVADAYTGRLTGSAVVKLDEPSNESQQAPKTKHIPHASYDAQIKLSDVPMGELLADWEHAAGIGQAQKTNDQIPQRQQAQARGTADAHLTLSGVLGQDQTTRRGRGRIQIRGGPVFRLPLLLPLIQVSNLQLPATTPIDFGEAIFYLQGNRVVIERVGVFAGSVEIFGYGQMILPTMALDLRITSRAVRRLPIINSIVEKFRNELITTKITGTPTEPVVSIIQFAHTKRLLANALGQKTTPKQKRMLEIERLSREAIARKQHTIETLSTPRRRGG